MKEITNISTLGIEKIHTDYSSMRLITPPHIRSMVLSIERHGQLQPIITMCEEDNYQLIDGFKRYFACRELCLPQLETRIIDVPPIVGKAMILSYNKTTGSLLDYEEGLVIQSLKRDHLMSQKEISELLCHSSSWVCRRLLLVEKLASSVQDSLRMGQLTSCHARQIIKLPRGNQQEFASCIIANNLTTSQATNLTSIYLESGTTEEKRWVLADPVKAIETKMARKDIYDCRLTAHGNKLLKTTELLTNQAHIFIGQYTGYLTGQLKASEQLILEPKVTNLHKKIRTVQSILEKNKI